MYKGKFIVIEHKAKRAGLHWDVRFTKPRSNVYCSFACRKTPPTISGQKIMAIRTTDHTEKEALFAGTIDSGYGAGELKMWDEGPCEIVKFEPKKHIIVDFKGRKLKGVYHFLSSNVILKNPHGDKGESYIFFRGKT